MPGGGFAYHGAAINHEKTKLADKPDDELKEILQEWREMGIVRRLFSPCLEIKALAAQDLLDKEEEREKWRKK